MKGRNLLPQSAAVLLGLAVLAGPAAGQTDARKALAYEAIDRNADQIATIGDTVYYFGELGMQEIESSKFVKGVLESIGFTVETGTAGMNTNVWAHWGTGKPQIVIVTEIDALPGGSQAPMSIDHKPLVTDAPGHMEGHNTHAGVAIGAAYAVKQAMQRYNIPGSVAISFGPAEEQIVSRPFLVRAGLYRDADAAILLHIGDTLGASYGLMNYAAISSKFTFHGKSAHGAVDPWNGKDAVDAVELMDIGFDKLVKIAEGAALMTGTTWEYQIDAAAWPQLGLKPVAEAIQANIDAVGMPRWSEDEQAFARRFQTAMGAKPIGLNGKPTALGQRPQSASSNDNGDVTWVVPSAMMRFPASVPGIGYHNWQAAVTPTSTIAHKGMIAGSKVLAGTILDLLTRPELLRAARAEFEKATDEMKYFAVLPADAKPPLELNKEIMERYRPAMRRFYLDKPVKFE